MLELAEARAVLPAVRISKLPVKPILTEAWKPEWGVSVRLRATLSAPSGQIRTSPGVCATASPRPAGLSSKSGCETGLLGLASTSSPVASSPPPQAGGS